LIVDFVPETDNIDVSFNDNDVDDVNEFELLVTVD